MQENANLNGTTDLVVARVKVERGQCDSPVCRCTVDLGGGVLREVEVTYPWFSYDGGLHMVGKSPSHTLYQEVTVQLVDDFGASLFQKDTTSFLGDLTFPSYFTNGLDPNYALESDPSTQIKQQNKQQNKNNTKDEAFSNTSNILDNYNETALDPTRRRRRRMARRRVLDKNDNDLDSSEDLIVQKLTSWRPPNENIKQARISRRSLLQNSDSANSSLAGEIYAACENFADRAYTIAEASMRLRNQVVTGEYMLSEANMRELDQNKNLNIQNCISDRYSQTASYCLGIQDCEKNQVERINLDLEYKEQSIYQDEMLALRNWINLIEETKVADLDFQAEFANALALILQTNNETKETSDSLSLLFQKIDEGQENLNSFANHISEAYLLMSDSFTDALQSQQSDLQTYTNLMETNINNLGSYFDFLDSFVKNLDRTINTNSLYLHRLINKGRTMSNVWKNMLKLLRNIVEGSAVKPYLTRGVQTLYQSNIQNGWHALLLEPPRPPVQWVDENGTQTRFDTNLYSWILMTQSSSVGGIDDSIPVVLKKKMDLVCDIVTLTYGEMNIDTLSQYLYLIGPPGCVPYKNCTCFLESKEFISTNPDINHRFAAHQLLHNIPMLYEHTEEYKDLFKVSGPNLFDWNLEIQTSPDVSLPPIYDFTIQAPKGDNQDDQGLGIHSNQGWEMIKNQTLLDPQNFQDFLSKQWSCDIEDANSTIPVRKNKNWFYDNWCLQNQAQRLEAWNNVSQYWLQSQYVSGDKYIQFSSFVLNEMNARCSISSGKIEDPWTYSYNMSKEFTDFYSRTETDGTISKHRFWGPGFGFAGLFRHIRSGLVRRTQPRPRLFLTPEMYAAQVSSIQSPQENILKNHICNGFISQKKKWDDPTLSHAWGYWRDSLLRANLSSGIDIVDFLYAPQQFKQIANAASLFWTSFDENAVSFITDLQAELYEYALGELPYPLYHKQRRAYFKSEYSEGETPPNDIFELPLTGGEIDDEYDFANKESRMLRSETVGMLSASPDSTPVWSLSGLKPHTKAEIPSTSFDSIRVRNVRLVPGSLTIPPTDFLVAGYWACWEQPCPQRVTLLDRRPWPDTIGTIEETASYRDPVPGAPCEILGPDSTDEELADAILSCPFFGGRASRAQPADGLYPYVLDLSQEQIRSVYSSSFEGRSNTPFYLFEPEAKEKQFINPFSTDDPFVNQSGPIFREHSRPLGDYLQEAKGDFRVENGKRHLGLHIARLRDSIPSYFLADDVEILSVSSLEKSCVQAKSINGLCSLLSNYYPSLKRIPGEVSTQYQAVRLYPKEWTQEVVLSIQKESNKGGQTLPSYSPAPFETECPDFRITQDKGNGWTITVVPQKTYIHNFVLTLNGCENENRPSTILYLPQPLFSRSWFVQFCNGDNVQLEIVTTLASTTKCVSFRGSPSIASPPDLSLVNSNTQKLIIETKNELAERVRSLGEIISNALYEGNDWDKIQEQLGSWVTEVPFTFDTEVLIAKLNQNIDVIDQELEELLQEIDDDRSEFIQRHKDYQENFEQNQKDFDNITRAYDNLKNVYDLHISQAVEGLQDFRYNIDRAYERYESSLPFFFFFGDPDSTYKNYELAFQWLTNPTPRCLLNYCFDEAGKKEFRAILQENCPSFFWKNRCTEPEHFKKTEAIWTLTLVITFITLWLWISLYAFTNSKKKRVKSRRKSRNKKIKKINLETGNPEEVVKLMSSKTSTD